MLLIRLEGILLQAVPCAWLPSALAGIGLPAELHWKYTFGYVAGLVDAPIIFGFTIAGTKLPLGETGLPKGSAEKSPLRIASEGSRPVKVIPSR